MGLELEWIKEARIEYFRTGMGLGSNRRFIMDTWFTTTRVR